MISPIGGTPPQDPAQAAADTRGASKAKSAKPLVPLSTSAEEAVSSAEDRVELSPLARDLQVLRAHMGDNAQDRTQRVLALRQAVNDGSYSVDGKGVARKIAETGW